MQVKAHGLILRSYDWREADRFFVLYTKEFGKIRATAKGVKRFSSKLAGHLQAFTELEFTLLPGHDAYIIIGVEMQTSFRHFSEDLHQATVLWAILGALQTLLNENDALPELYDGVLSVIQELSLAQRGEYPLIFWHFIATLVYVLGYRPELLSCVGCNLELYEGIYFSLHRGGVLCSNCIGVDSTIRMLDPDTVSFLRKSFSSDFTARIDTPHIVSSVAILLSQFIEYHTGRVLPVILDNNFS